MKGKLLAAALAAMWIVTGCASTDVVAGRYDTADHYPNVTLSERSLQDALGFQEPVISQTPSGLMRVTIPLRARSNDELHLEYRFVWLDDEGAPVQPEMNWRPLRLEPRQPQYVSASASSAAAENYNFQVRWGRP